MRRTWTRNAGWSKRTDAPGRRPLLMAYSTISWLVTLNAPLCPSISNTIPPCGTVKCIYPFVSLTLSLIASVIRDLARWKRLPGNLRATASQEEKGMKDFMNQYKKPPTTFGNAKKIKNNLAHEQRARRKKRRTQDFEKNRKKDRPDSRNGESW